MNVYFDKFIALIPCYRHDKVCIEIGIASLSYHKLLYPLYRIENSLVRRQRQLTSLVLAQQPAVVVASFAVFLEVDSIPFQTYAVELQDFVLCEDECCDRLHA